MRFYVEVLASVRRNLLRPRGMETPSTTAEGTAAPVTVTIGGAVATVYGVVRWLSETPAYIRWLSRFRLRWLTGTTKRLRRSPAREMAFNTLITVKN